MAMWKSATVSAVSGSDLATGLSISFATEVCDRTSDEMG
jgi:hypothetical protein